MSRYTALRRDLAGLSPPADPDLPGLLDWALCHLPGCAEEQIADIVGMIAERAWHTDGQTLEALLPKLVAVDVLHQQRCGSISRDLWVHAAKNLDHPLVWRTLTCHMLTRDPTGRHASRYAERALKAGVRDPDIVRAAAMGRIQRGQLSRAAALVRRSPRCLDRAILLHIATEPAPLPEPDCGCADHDSPSEAAPPTRWLKAFFEEGDSLYDATHHLCLSCHTLWAVTEGYMQEIPRWSREPLSALQSPGGWHLGMDDAFPGEAVVGDLTRMAAWIRGLSEPTFSYGMV